MKASRVLGTAAVLAALVQGGCRNPFNPPAQIRFDRFYAGENFAQVLSIKQTDALSIGKDAANINRLRTTAQFSNTSTVRGTITGYTTVYRQISSGKPIESCGGAAGRRFSTVIMVDGLKSNAATSLQAFTPIMMITSELLSHISTDLTTLNGGIDCETTFYGEDENGYEIEVEGVLHIDVL